VLHVYLFGSQHIQLIVDSDDHRVHTEWQRPLSGVHSIMMENSAMAGEGGGVHAHLLSFYCTVFTITYAYKVAVYSTL
jgi:hypothetical protein